jgi:hypothetical protein
MNALKLLFCSTKSEIKTWINNQKGIFTTFSTDILKKSFNNLISLIETKKRDYILKLIKFKCLLKQDYFVNVGIYILEDGIEILESVVLKCKEELKSIS